MEELLSGLRAVAEATRIRILFVLSHGEFNVSELTQILGQSQPRVSRHLKLMTDAGLLSRHKEGNWVLFRLREEGLGGALSRAIAHLLPGSDQMLAADISRLEAIRAQRAERAAAYFSSNAARWEGLRKLHISEADVDAAILRLAGSAPIGILVDLGTGTGQVLRLLGGRARQAIGIDTNLDMLAAARAHLREDDARHIQLRQADIYALPFQDGFADLVTIHQVLHYLDDPANALAEAARILRPGGQLLVVDFAPHELEELRTLHEHRRLGIAAEHMSGWLARAGLEAHRHEVLPPPWRKEGTGLTVSIWLAEKPGPAVPAGATSKRRESTQ